MKIKAVCEATSLTDRTVRYYIDEGLLFPDYDENYLGRKTFNFSQSDIDRLKEISVLRRFGFSLSEIREMIQHPEQIIPISKQLRLRKQNTIDEEHQLLQALSQLNPYFPYTLSKLAKCLSEPTVKHSAPVEDNHWRFDYSFEDISSILRSFMRTLRAILIGLVFFLLLIGLIIFAFTSVLGIFSFPKVYSGTEHYHMIYDNVQKVNKSIVIKSMQYETLLGFGRQSMYNSYLLLFPREQPENLKEFEYYWKPDSNQDSYSIYFSYELDENEYQTFKEGLSNFSLTCNAEDWYGQISSDVRKPIYTDDLFEYPTYIFTWSKNTERFGCCEYILLDDAHHTVINVFMTLRSLEDVQQTASYNILPKDNDQNSVEKLVSETAPLASGKDEGFCIYFFKNFDLYFVKPALEDLEYSLDFMPQS